MYYWRHFRILGQATPSFKRICFKLSWLHFSNAQRQHRSNSTSTVLVIICVHWTIFYFYFLDKCVGTGSSATSRNFIASSVFARIKARIASNVFHRSRSCPKGTSMLIGACYFEWFLEYCAFYSKYFIWRLVEWTTEQSTDLRNMILHLY
jgi:hypothetical protein